MRDAALSAADQGEGRDHHAAVPGPVPGAHRVRVGDRGEPVGRRPRRRHHYRGVLHAAVRHRRADDHRVLAVPREVRLCDGARGVQQVAHIVRPVDAQHVAVPGHPVPVGQAGRQSHTRARRPNGRVRFQHHVRDATVRQRARRRVQPVLLLILR